MPKRLIALGAALLALAAAACTDAAVGQAAPQPYQRGEGQPYEVLGSQVWDVADPATGRDYQVFVALPPSYDREPQRRYPVLYVTDADYAFPVIRQIARRMNVEGPRVEEFILVGLSYSRGDDGMTSRRRDYTPTRNGPSNSAGSAHGEAAAYQTYLRDRVKPFVESRFRTDAARELFLGHSYGSLLGARILLTEPDMFDGYVLGSPSLWFDNHHAWTLEEAYAARHRDLKAKVFLYIGEYEAARPNDPRFNRSRDMVADNREFERRLLARRYPGLELKSEVLNDEDHVSVAPRGFTRALLWLLPAR